MIFSPSSLSQQGLCIKGLLEMIPSPINANNTTTNP